MNICSTSNQGCIERINEKLSQFLIILIPLSFFVGHSLRGWGLKHKWTAYPVLFSIMFASSYGLKIKNFLEVKNYKKSFLVSLFAQLFILPITSIIVTSLFYKSRFNFTYGHYALALAPSAISTIIWSRISNGNIPLATTLVGAHAIIVPYFTPIALKILTGKTLKFSAQKLFLDLFVTVFAPTVLAILTYNPKVEVKTKSVFGVWSKIGLLYMIILNTAIAFDVVPINLTLLKVFLVTGILIMLAFFVGYLIGKILKLDEPSKITITYYMGMKNNGAGFVIIFAGFPHEAIFPLAAAMMWQQPLASIINALKGKNEKGSINSCNRR